MAVYKSYVEVSSKVENGCLQELCQAILCRSEAWCLKESEIGIF